MKRDRTERLTQDPSTSTTGGEPREHRPAALGMLMGIVAGSGAAGLLFAVTGDALWFLLVGFSTAIGLLAGASVEARRKANEADARRT